MVFILGSGEMVMDLGYFVMYSFIKRGLMSYCDGFLCVFKRVFDFVILFIFGNKFDLNRFNVLVDSGSVSFFDMVYVYCCMRD